MECLPTANPLYSHKADGLKTEYHAAFEIEYKVDDPNLKWKVHLGDVIAFSCAPLTSKTIQEFTPDHYQKASPHWKLGLVTLLKQEQSPKSPQTISIQVRILEKILDTPFGKDKKITETFRPYNKNSNVSQLPHVLVKTMDYQTIEPNQILPLRIHMVKRQEIQQPGAAGSLPGINHEEDEDHLNLKFFVAKEIVSQTNSKPTLVNTKDPDVWVQLNPHKELKPRIPEPLRESWQSLAPGLFHQLPELLSTLVSGFKQVALPSKWEQHMEHLNQNWTPSSQDDDDTGEDPSSEDQESLRKKKPNKRSAPSSKKRSSSSKRVRIQTPDEENANPNHPSSKSSATKKTANAKPPSILSTRKRKASISPAPSKPEESTVSTSTTMSSSPTPRASPKRRKNSRVAKVLVEESSLLLRMHGKEYYPEVKNPIDLEVFDPKKKIQPENNHLDIALGQIVAIRTSGAMEDSKMYNHHNITRDLLTYEAVQWSPAQVVSIFRKKDKSSWHLQVRWFFGLEELSQQAKQTMLADKSFACSSANLSNAKVIESTTVDAVELNTVLPIHVQVSSTAKKVLEFHEDGLPLVRLACKHLLTNEEIVSIQDDWTDYQDQLGGLPDALQRGFEKLARTLEEKTLRWIKEAYGGDSNSDEESESASSQSAVEGSSNDGRDENDQDDTMGSQQLEVASLASIPLYDRWNREFHDGVRIDVDRDSLVRSFVPKTRQWTIKVGFVVPIRLNKEDLPKGLKKKKDYWHPFVEPWSAAQIVSIYKKKVTNEWMMQVRWFDRFVDLLPDQKAAVKNFDKPYVVFETEQYTQISLDSVFPGRIIMTSSDVDSWAVETSFLTGLPLIPRLCGHICLDDEIDTTRDWTNYDLSLKSLPQPLSRGLMLDPINRENKSWILMLSRYYKAAIVSRGMDPDESSIKKWKGVEGRPLSMDAQKYDDSTVQISETEKVFSTGSSPGLHFFSKLSLTIPSENLVEPSKVEKRSKEYVLSCKVGDIVCFYDEAAAPRADYVTMKHLKHLWHPYRVPWCFGQVLSIHKNSKKGSCQVELRRFLRHSDLPAFVRTFAPSATDNDREELFESDIVVEVPASRLVGTADVFFSNFEKAANMNRSSSHEKARVSFRCKYFFEHKAKRIQPIVGSSMTPEPWFRECRSRSFQFSSWARKYNLSQEESVVSPRPTGTTVVDLLGSGSKTKSKPFVQLESSTSERTLYLETKIQPNWLKYQHRGPFQSSGEQWKIQVGDFVAVRTDATNDYHATDPFTDNWTAAQILAIFMDSGIDSNRIEEEARIHVRLLNMKEVAENEIPVLEPLESVELLTIRADDLRGPLLVCRGGDLFDDAWKRTKNHMPSIPCWGNDLLYSSFEKSLENCALYTSDGIKEVLSKVDDQQLKSHKVGETDSDPDGSGMTVAWTPSKPFHIDLSQLRTFYDSMKLIPPRQMYAVSAEYEDHKEPWTVRMGDVVLIRCEGARRYPMDCGWSVAEVVAIFKDFDSTDELEKDQHTRGDRAINAASLRVEIRWLYERHDLKRDRTVETEVSGDYEEVFESDHVDVVDGEDLLCPAKLVSDPSKFVEPESFRGITVNQYVCKRFWSTKRKALIPCGKLEGRQERGWLYSRNFPQEVQNKYGALNLQSSGTRRAEESTIHSWHENMNRVISKLTLLDASTGAYERGEGLIGREKELNELLSFFRAAIRGTAGTGGVKSSLFLAGSPGVGKTACVRAALAQLRDEQSTGAIPKFNLISLNGMELRHPFEAYGKFWEALTGLKHVGTHEAAAARLTRHFTSPMAQGGKQNNPVTVLLLDEIDYLMTEKQTVLYDFFDWPKRAAELRHGRRLVVVGISNTLNLADQLLQSVRSRLGSENKLLFKSYDLKETIAILDAKMKEASPNMKIFDKDAILLASKKTAGLSGDIRKVFKICRDAAKLVLRRWEESDSALDSTNNFPTVRIGDVQKASLQSLETALKVAVSFSSPYQALLLISIASLKRATGREGNFDIKDIMMKMEAISSACGQAQYSPPPSFARTMDLLTILAERGLVSLTTARSTMVSFRANKGGSGGAWPLVSLMVGEDQLSHGLKKTAHQDLCEKNIPSLY